MGSVLEEVIGKLGILVGANGSVLIKSRDMRQVYGKARAAMLSQLAECIQSVGGAGPSMGDARIRQGASYLRNYQIISQPECIDIFGRSHEAFQLCR